MTKLLTPAQEQEIRNRIGAGESKPQVAKEFNVSVGTVYNTLKPQTTAASVPKKKKASGIHGFGTRGPAMTKAEIAQIRAMRREGKTQLEIATKLRRSESSISRVLVKKPVRVPRNLVKRSPKPKSEALAVTEPTAVSSTKLEQYLDLMTTAFTADDFVKVQSKLLDQIAGHRKEADVHLAAIETLRTRIATLKQLAGQ